MKFRDKMTGAIYEPNEAVAALMADNPNLEKVEQKPTPKAAAKKAQPKKEQ